MIDRWIQVEDGYTVPRCWIPHNPGTCFYGDHAEIYLSILLAAGRRDQVPLLADAPAVLVGRLARASRLGGACWWRGARKASSEPCADLEARVVRLGRLLVQRGEVEVKPDGPRVLRRQRQLPAVTVRRGSELSSAVTVRRRGRYAVVVPAQLLGKRQHRRAAVNIHTQLTSGRKVYI